MILKMKHHLLFLEASKRERDREKGIGGESQGGGKEARKKRKIEEESKEDRLCSPDSRRTQGLGVLEAPVSSFWPPFFYSCLLSISRPSFIHLPVPTFVPSQP